MKDPLLSVCCSSSISEMPEIPGKTLMRTNQYMCQVFCIQHNMMQSIFTGQDCTSTTAEKIPGAIPCLIYAMQQETGWLKNSSKKYASRPHLTQSGLPWLGDACKAPFTDAGATVSTARRRLLWPMTWPCHPGSRERACCNGHWLCRISMTARHASTLQEGSALDTQHY